MVSTESLVSLHKRILDAKRDYDPPWPLLGLVDDAYCRCILEEDDTCYYQWLALLVRFLKPRLVLELGSYLGVSTIMMYAELAKNSHLVSCDIATKLSFVPQIMRADPRVHFVEGNDLNLNVYGERLPLGIDILFIDTEHEFDQITAEWEIYKYLCRPGAVVILDDIKLNGMPDFWASLEYPKVDISEDCHLSGFGMFKYEPGAEPKSEDAYRASLRIAYSSLERHSEILAQSKSRTGRIEALRSALRRFHGTG